MANGDKTPGRVAPLYSPYLNPAYGPLAEEEEEEALGGSVPGTAPPVGALPVPLPTRSTSSSTSVTPGSPHAKQWGDEQAAQAQREKEMLTGREPGEVGSLPGTALEIMGVPQSVSEAVGFPKELTEKEKWDQDRMVADKKASALEAKAVSAESWAMENKDETKKAASFLNKARVLKNKATDIRRKQELNELSKRGKLGEQLSSIKREEWQYEDEIGLLSKEIKSWDARSTLEKAAFDGVSSRLKTINDKVKTAKIDPDRYISNMPLWAKVLTFVGAALGGYTEGFSGGRIKNRAFDLLNAAINRDINAQRANMDKLLSERNYTAKERSFIYDKMSDTIKNKKVAALRASKIRLAKVALFSKEANVKYNIANEIIRIDKGISDTLFKAKELARTKKRSSYSARTGVKWYVPKAAKGAKGVKGTRGELPPTAVMKDWKGTMNTLTMMNTALGEVEKIKDYGPISKRYPNTEQKRLRDVYLIPLAVSLRKARGETGVMTEADFQRYKAIIDPWFANPKELRIRIKQLRADTLKGAATTLRSYKNRWDMSDQARQLKEAWPTKSTVSPSLPKGTKKQK